MDKIVSVRKIDEYYMSRALSLASRGQGAASPNPMVGWLELRQQVFLTEPFADKMNLPFEIGRAHV